MMCRGCVLYIPFVFDLQPETNETINAPLVLQTLVAAKLISRKQKSQLSFSMLMFCRSGQTKTHFLVCPIWRITKCFNIFGPWNSRKKQDRLPNVLASLSMRWKSDSARTLGPRFPYIHVFTASCHKLLFPFLALHVCPRHAMAYMRPTFPSTHPVHASSFSRTF